MAPPFPPMLLQLLNRRMLLCALLGFSSGLPYYVLVSLLPAWLRVEGVSLSAIAALSIMRLPYSWKFLWAPFLDRYSLPWLSRRRDFALLTQLGLLVLVGCFGLLMPSRSLLAIPLLSLTVAIFSATQDIAIDAYRRELLPDEELGLGNSLAVNLYRVSGLVPGGLGLVLADRLGFSRVFWVVAGFMLIGIITSLWAPAVVTERSPRTLREAVVGPLCEFFTRGEKKGALWLLAFLFFYKLGDNLATTLATPFYLDMGFTLAEIGTVVKGISLASMVVGSLLGGVMMTRIGITRALWSFGMVQLLSILGFYVLALVGRDLWMLGAVVAGEYLGVGLGSAALVAFVAKTTDRRFTATQFSLLSSFISLPGILAGAQAGFLVETLGYPRFFLLCTALGLPGMLLLCKVAPWNGKSTGYSPGTQS